MFQLARDYWQFFAFLGLVGIFLLVLRLLERRRKLPYEKRPRLLSEAETAFYRVLHAATAGDWPVFAMVRLADLIRVSPQAGAAQSWQNRIAAKHLDFVLCDPESLEAKLAIELDDSSHQRPDRQERDDFVDQALESAGLPLLRVPCAASYDRTALRKSIREKLGLSG